MPKYNAQVTTPNAFFSVKGEPAKNPIDLKRKLKAYFSQQTGHDKSKIFVDTVVKQ